MTSRSHTQDLRNDLLADLRSAVPPASPSPAPAVQAAEDGAGGGHPALASSTPSVEVRISLQRWSLLHLKASPAGSGLVLRGGPLRLHLGLSRD